MSVLHHENHASGIIVLAALYNALKVVGKSLQDVRVVINGAGVCRHRRGQRPGGGRE